MRIYQYKLSRPRDEDGAVAVVVAILSVLLIVIAAFTTDFGMAYAQRQALATGADSAALAVIHAEYTSQVASPTRTCATALTQDAALAATDPLKASKIALTQIQANAPFNATIADSDVSTTLSCASSGTVLQVDVVVNRTMKRILGNVVGASSMRLSREAVAALGVENQIQGLAPIALCTNQADAIMAYHDADVAAGRTDGAQLLDPEKVWTGKSACDVNSKAKAGSGNWGWLDFGGLADKSNGTIGEPVLAASVKAENGTVKLSSGSPPSALVSGVPGNRANGAGVHDEMVKLLGKILTFPVYNSMDTSGGGSGAVFTITGFLSVKLCGFDGSLDVTCAQPGLAVGANVMEIRYVNYTPIGQMDELCAIGSPCASRLYVTKLLKVDGSS